MMNLLPNLIQTYFDGNGLPLANGKLYSYLAGSSTPLATYTDASGGTANTNPVILDANGEASVWINDQAYKFVLKDASDNVLWTVDNVQWIPDGSITTAKIANDAVTTAKIADGAVGTTEIADASVTTAKIPDNAITGPKIPDGSIEPSKLDPAFDFTQLTNAIECVAKSRGDYSGGAGFSVVPQKQWTAPTLISNPATLPAGNGWRCAWSPTGEYLAVAHENNPRFSIYQRRGNKLIKLTDPSALPGSNGLGIAWSPKGDMLAVAIFGPPYVVLYKRFGSDFEAFTTFSPGGATAASSVSWSPNGEFFATTMAGPAPYVSIVRMFAQTSHGISTVPSLAVSTSGGNTYSDSAVNNAFNIPKNVINSNFTSIDGLLTAGETLWSPSSSGISISAQPAGSPSCGAWSPDSQFYAVSHTTSPYITIYQRSQFTFTKLGDPASLPPGDASGVAWSPSGEFLVVTHAASPYLTIYQRSGTTFTKLSNPATLPAGGAGVPDWSPNSRYLAIPHQTSPYITIYDRNGTTFTKLSAPTDVLAGQGSSAAWSPTNQFLAVTMFATPYISVYQTASTNPKNAILYIREAPDV